MFIWKRAGVFTLGGSNKWNRRILGIRRRMDRRDNARTEELNNLRLALAAFDLQLAAFEMRLQLTAVEMRMDRAPLRGGPKPGIPAARPDSARRLQKENEPWSIRSLGKKPDM